MSEILEDPPRWRERTDQLNLTERELGQALRAMSTRAPLSGPQLARLAAGLRQPRTGRSSLWLAVAASFVVGAATAASAAHLNILPRWLAGSSSPRPEAAPTPRANGSGRAARRSTAAVSALAPAAEPDRQAIAPAPVATKTSERRGSLPGAWSGRPSVSAERSGAPRVADSLFPPLPLATEFGTAPPPDLATSPGPESPMDTSRPQGAYRAMLEQLAPPPSSAVVAGGSTAVGEPGATRILADAIRILRVDGSPEAALALLDRHASLLAKSSYEREGLLVRVEALLALKRERELLRLLDESTLTDGTSWGALLVVRARLRAAANRCVEAVADFDRVLAAPGHLAAQALLGRASCRDKLGDAAGARADRQRARRESPGAH
jgi:hypothetical protein